MITVHFRLYLDLARSTPSANIVPVLPFMRQPAVVFIEHEYPPCLSISFEPVLDIVYPLEVQSIELHGSSSSSTKIPRPCGEVGRPGKGGFSLAYELGWSDNLYVKVQVSDNVTITFVLPRLTTQTKQRHLQKLSREELH